MASTSSSASSSSLRLAGIALPYPEEVVDGILDRAGGGIAKVVLRAGGGTANMAKVELMAGGGTAKVALLVGKGVGSTLGAGVCGTAKVWAGWNIMWCSAKEKNST